MRVLIDTNVLVKAQLFNDEHARRVLSLCMQRNTIAVVTDNITDEWGHVLSGLIIEKSGSHLTQTDFARTIARLASVMKAIFRLTSRAEHVKCGPSQLYSEDRGDDMYVQCAVEHDVSIILSYDDHLGSLTGKYRTCSGQAIEVLTPYQFWKQHSK